MLILTFRTDKPEAEIGLFKDNKELTYLTWTADRSLSLSIHKKLKQQLTKSKKKLTDINGIVIYKGPGSFTGLRIGISVANALAYSLQIPIVSATGNDWCSKGINRLISGQTEEIVKPKYGALPHITAPRK